MKLAKRLSAAVIFTPLMLLSIFHTDPVFGTSFYFFYLFPLFLVLFGGLELNNLLSAGPVKPMRLLFLVLALAAVAGTFGPLSDAQPHHRNWLEVVSPAEWYFLVALAGLLLITSWKLMTADIEGSVEECGQGLLFLFVIAVPAGFLSLIYRLPAGSWLIAFFYIVAWMVDTGGYFIGWSLGKTKLSPKISPKKTIAGFWGGMGFGAASALALKWGFAMQIPFGYADAFFLSVMLGIAAQIGDLVESLLKRQMQIKDSGAIIPGHGGILDIFDGILYSAPLVYLYLAVFVLPKMT